MNSIALDATGADADPLRSSTDDCADGLKIDVPAALGHIVGVADLISELRALAAQITSFCHNLFSLAVWGLVWQVEFEGRMGWDDRFIH